MFLLSLGMTMRVCFIVLIPRRGGGIESGGLRGYIVLLVYMKLVRSGVICVRDKIIVLLWVK